MPKFRQLDKPGHVKTETLEQLYREIMKDIADHHLSLTVYNHKASEDDVKSFTIDPGQEEMQRRDYYHPFYRPVTAWKTCLARYISEGRITDFTGGQDNNMQAWSYNMDNGIIYLYMSNFMITPAAKDGVVMQVIKNYQRMVLNTPDIKGIIIDVRENTGGYLNDMNYVIAPLIDRKLTIGYTRTKEGLGRLDYSPWLPSIVSPAQEHRNITAPIVVLADIYSMSMSEMTAMAVKAMPNGKIIGERTSGATGPLTDLYHYTYSGQVNNKENLSLYTSTWLMKDSKGQIYEGVGITPDIEVLYDEDAINAGTDTQLERAIEYIKTGR